MTDENVLARLYEAADDGEMETLDRLREKAGLTWTCPNCRWFNIEENDICEECGTPKP